FVDNNTIHVETISSGPGDCGPKNRAHPVRLRSERSSLGGDRCRLRRHAGGWLVFETCPGSAELKLQPLAPSRSPGHVARHRDPFMEDEAQRVKAADRMYKAVHDPDACPLFRDGTEQAVPDD